MAYVEGRKKAFFFLSFIFLLILSLLLRCFPDYGGCGFLHARTDTLGFPEASDRMGWMSRYHRRVLRWPLLFLLGT